MKLTDYISALPDCYAKHPESNNYKLLRLEYESVKALYEDIEAVWKVLDIWNATGQTLDMYGEIYEKPRGAMTDEQYRYSITQQAAITLMGSDHASVVGAIASALGVDKSEVQIQDAEVSAFVDALILYDKLRKDGMTAEEARKFVVALLPSGVGLNNFGVLHLATESMLKVATAVTFAEEFTVEVIE